MRVLRPASFFISLCLHVGIICFAIFWTPSSSPLVDLTNPVIDIGIYTIGKPGRMPADAPAAPPESTTPPVPAAVPETPPEAPTPPPDTAKPEPIPAIPDPTPEPPKPEPPKLEPPKPEPPKTEAPKTPEPPKPEKTKPEPAKPKPTQPRSARPAKPSKSPEQILREALSGLSGEIDPDALASDSGPGGSGGDGIGLLGSYTQSLRSRIQPNWEYQGRADRSNPVAVVEISIAQDGLILEAVIVSSSGDPSFDGSALKAVYDTKRVEPPPTPDLMRVQLPFALEGPR